LEHDFALLRAASEKALENEAAPPETITALKHFLSRTLAQYELLGGTGRVRKQMSQLLEQLAAREFATFVVRRGKSVSKLAARGIRTNDPLLIAQFQRLSSGGHVALSPELQGRLDREQTKKRTVSRRNPKTATVEGRGIRTTDPALLTALEKLRTLK
jgi:hypothetical protein